MVDNDTSNTITKILIIDDAEVFGLRLRDLFSKQNYRVRYVSTFEEAKSELSSGFFPHVILTDLMLDGINIGPLIPKFRKAEPKALIVVMTFMDYQSARKTEQLREEGADEVICKSGGYNSILESIEYLRCKRLFPPGFVDI